jgi:hypothetical protein
MVAAAESMSVVASIGNKCGTSELWHGWESRWRRQSAAFLCRFVFVEYISDRQNREVAKGAKQDAKKGGEVSGAVRKGEGVPTRHALRSPFFFSMIGKAAC